MRESVAKVKETSFPMINVELTASVGCSRVVMGSAKGSPLMGEIGGMITGWKEHDVERTMQAQAGSCRIYSVFGFFWFNGEAEGRRDFAPIPTCK